MSNIGADAASGCNISFSFDQTNAGRDGTYVELHLEEICGHFSLRGA
jgi:hypothetical protein